MIKVFQNSTLYILITVFFMIHISCTPPKSLYKMEGSPSLISKINKIIEESEIDVTMSIQVISLKDDKIIYDYNSQKLLMPASTNKLYACAAALHFLGKDHQFKTDILSNQKNLILKGGGDSDLSVKEIDSLALEVSKKYKDIDTLFIDDSFLDSLNYGEGWMWDEGAWWYAAPISALSVNDNCIDFYVGPGKKGNRAAINYFPKTSYIDFNNESITVQDSIESKLKIDRNWISNKNNFHAYGEIIDTSDVDTLYRNIYDPSTFTGTIFRESLEKYGTRVKNISKKKTSKQRYKNISTHLSKPLLHSAVNLMNESDNLTAELFVKSIGAMDTIPGTWDTGLDSIKSFLAEKVLIDTANIRLADGSGVSRYNLTNSAQLNSLLKWMYNSEYKDDFISTLPGGGWKNSTLKKRLTNEGDLVRAKTGGLSGVRNLAGYIKSKKYGDVAFSILMNGYTDYSSRYARVHDQIVKTIIYD